MESTRKTTLTIILSCMLLAFSIGVVYAQSFTTYLESGSMVASADYIIFKDGTTHYSRNGKTGKIDFTSTDFSLLFQLSVDSGDKIYLHEGLYIMDVGVTLDNVTTIDGDGWGVVLKADDAITITLLSATDKSDITIRNIKLDGNRDNVVMSNLLVFTNCTDIIVDNVFFYNALSIGVKFKHNARNSLVVNCRFEAIGRNALNIGGDGYTAVGTIISNNVFVGNGLDGAEYADIFVVEANDTIVDSNILRHGLGQGIKFETTIYGAIISGNNVFNFSEGGIVLGGEAPVQYVTISYNYVEKSGWGEPNAPCIKVSTSEEDVPDMRYINIIGNSVKDADGMGIQFYGYNSTISNNIIIDSGRDVDAISGEYQGILVKGKWIIISGNIIMNPIRNIEAGIQLFGSGTDYILISSCMVKNGFTLGIIPFGDNTRVVDSWNGTEWVSSYP